MTLLEEEYYKRWIAQVQENKKLRLEIEKMKKIEDYNSNFKEELLFCRREIKRYDKAVNSLKRRLEYMQNKNLKKDTNYYVMSTPSQIS